MQKKKHKSHLKFPALMNPSTSPQMVDCLVNTVNDYWLSNFLLFFILFYLFLSFPTFLVEFPIFLILNANGIWFLVENWPFSK